MPENTENGANNATDTARKARERLRSKVKLASNMARMAASQGFVKTTRISMPLIKGYTGCDEDQPQHDNINGEELPDDTLSQGEKTLLMNAGAKLAFETVALATLAYPSVEGIEPYVAVKNRETGCYPAPHLAHVLSVGKAIQDLFGDQLFGSGKEPPDQDSAELANKEPVLLVALSNNEYGYLNSPIEPRTIRRIALNQRDRIVNDTTQGSTSRSVRR